jgi:hypothetical protein
VCWPSGTARRRLNLNQFFEVLDTVWRGSTPPKESERRLEKVLGRAEYVVLCKSLEQESRSTDVALRPMSRIIPRINTIFVGVPEKSRGGPDKNTFVDHVRARSCANPSVSVRRCIAEEALVSVDCVFPDVHVRFIKLERYRNRVNAGWHSTTR